VDRSGHERVEITYAEEKGERPHYRPEGDALPLYVIMGGLEEDHPGEKAPDHGGERTESRQPGADYPRAD
jgi:hypothetical protein